MTSILSTQPPSISTYFTNVIIKIISILFQNSNSSNLFTNFFKTIPSAPIMMNDAVSHFHVSQFLQFSVCQDARVFHVFSILLCDLLKSDIYNITDIISKHYLLYSGSDSMIVLTLRVWWFFFYSLGQNTLTSLVCTVFRGSPFQSSNVCFCSPEST